MAIKPSFSLILCCFFLASVLFIPHAIVGRRLEEVKEDDNGQSKAGVTKSHANTAPSWVGNDSPPTSNRATKVSNANMIARSKLGNGAKDCSPDIYNRNCRR
ncbi:uncharacterized protein LOC111317547 [Durio zibethinus]|uniref:Uncharacterized protein LOC111317547 n=1 Tax=Durio zibethinus TaxID=66656 RepID=A0A6P6BF33_DURZI|nr:uncharacterized protein LOC111317547 [Durio zibethinus]